MIRFFSLLGLICLMQSLTAQSDTLGRRPFNDTTLLSPVTVIDSTHMMMVERGTPLPFADLVTRDMVSASAQSDLPALLKSLTGADIRQRGIHDIQADISLRGGSFEQTLVLVNGIPFNDPQTGHHSMNLPFSLDDIERIEVFGPTEGGALWSGYAMGGAVNIVTRNNQMLSREVRAGVTAGSYGLRRGHAALQFNTGRWGHYVSVDESFSDGHTHNTDFRRRQLWMNTHALLRRGVALQLDGGWVNKAFGANSFYSPLFPDQAEEITASGLAARLSGGNRLRWTGWYSARMHHDRFELFRHEAPVWYQGHNHHRTLVENRGGELRKTTKIGELCLGWLSRSEQINSNVLGKPTDDSVAVPGHEAWYTHADRRDWSELTLVFNSRPVKGVRAESAVTAAWLPDGEVFPAFRVHLVASPQQMKNTRFSAGVSRNYRLPTFTEMYYQGPTNTGNPLLQHEEAITIDMNARYRVGPLEGRATLFFRDNNNLIDWVKGPEETLWRSENLTRIFTRGAVLRLSYHPETQTKGISFASASWSYTDQVKKESDHLISYYVLDHLRHKVTLTAHLRLGKKVFVTTDLLWQQRDGSYTNTEGEQTPYPDALLWDAGAKFQMTEVLQWQINAHNLLNTEHYDFSGVVHPGRWFSVGLRLQSPW